MWARIGRFIKTVAFLASTFPRAGEAADNRYASPEATIGSYFAAVNARDIRGIWNSFDVSSRQLMAQREGRANFEFPPPRFEEHWRAVFQRMGRGTQMSHTILEKSWIPEYDGFFMLLRCEPPLPGGLSEVPKLILQTSGTWKINSEIMLGAFEAIGEKLGQDLGQMYTSSERPSPAPSPPPDEDDGGHGSDDGGHGSNDDDEDDGGHRENDGGHGADDDRRENSGSRGSGRKRGRD